MLRLSSAFLLLLAACFGGLVLGELSSDFSQCRDFFFKGTRPQGIDGSNYQPICQRYKNEYCFASLYNRQRRAPLFSAYQLKVSDDKRPKDNWMYEPQLANANASPNMKVFIRQKVDQSVMESQAVPDDYTNSGFTKGQLNPNLHQGTEEDRKATFTLTNIVPQKEVSNLKTWLRVEEKWKKFASYCKGSMYVITGALPYAPDAPKRRINDRVSVPEYLWSAYCCQSVSDQLPAGLKKFFPAYAAVGRNDRNSSEEFVPVDVKAKDDEKGYDVKYMPVSALESILSQRLAPKISLFSGCK